MDDDDHQEMQDSFYNLPDVVKLQIVKLYSVDHNNQETLSLQLQNLSLQSEIKTANKEMRYQLEKKDEFFEMWHYYENQCKYYKKYVGRKEEDCSICHEKIEPSTHVILSCSHIFHADCISKIKTTDEGLYKCPLCNNTFLLKNIMKHYNNINN